MATLADQLESAANQEELFNDNEDEDTEAPPSKSNEEAIQPV